MPSGLHCRGSTPRLPGVKCSGRRASARDLLLLVLVSSVLGCESQLEDRWQGFGYPDRSDLRTSIRLGEFASLNACRSTASAFLARNPDGDYECGRNCRFEEKYGLYICDETLR